MLLQVSKLHCNRDSLPMLRSNMEEEEYYTVEEEFERMYDQEMENMREMEQEGRILSYLYHRLLLLCILL